MVESGGFSDQSLKWVFLSHYNKAFLLIGRFLFAYGPLAPGLTLHCKFSDDFLKTFALGTVSFFFLCVASPILPWFQDFPDFCSYFLNKGIADSLGIDKIEKPVKLMKMRKHVQIKLLIMKLRSVSGSREN